MDNPFKKIPVERFNHFCSGFVLVWLLLSIPAGILWRPTVPDFGQFYIGGLLAARGEWKALYPMPVYWSQDNPGLSIHSFAKPRWKLLAYEKGIPDYTHFMLPPPSAVLFTPFVYARSYTQAFWAWTGILILAVWGLGANSCKILRKLKGMPTRYEGFLFLLIAFSPMTARAIRISNVSPLLALLLSIVLLGLVQEGRSVRISLALISGALLKYATLILAPLLFALRRWSILFWTWILGVCVLLFTYVIAGAEPFREFVNVIMPTLSRPSAFRGNQSLPGMLARIFGRPLPEQVAIILNVARLSSLAVILAIFGTLSRDLWKRTEIVLSGAGLLLGWLLIFSPIAWEHWPILLCPLWGWLLWEMRSPGLIRKFAISSLILMYFPAGIIQVPGIASYKVLLPEPLNSSQLLGVLIFTVLSFWRLNAPRLREPESVKEILKIGNLHSEPKSDQTRS